MIELEGKYVELALGLARVKKAEEAEEKAYAERKEAQKALARLLGRKEEGKDFEFEADYDAKCQIIDEVVRQAKGLDC
jgi:outer membrane protein TolC